MDQEGERMIRLATIGTNFITDWFMEGVQELEEIKLTPGIFKKFRKRKAVCSKIWCRESI